jgi:hypothetical protein
MRRIIGSCIGGSNKAPSGYGDAESCFIGPVNAGVVVTLHALAGTASAVRTAATALKPDRGHGASQSLRGSTHGYQGAVRGRRRACNLICCRVLRSLRCHLAVPKGKAHSHAGYKSGVASRGHTA